MRRTHGLRLLGLSIVGALCVAWLSDVLQSRCEAQENSGAAYVSTAREGLAYRAWAIRSATGTAELHYTFSPANCERRRNEAEERARLTKWIGEVLPLDPTHRSRLTFSVDFTEGCWLCDLTDLAVSGHSLWASSRDPALNRGLPPETFRRVATCDGTKTYVHDHSLNRGWIEAYSGEPSQLPQPLAYIKAAVVAPAATIRALTGSAHSLEFLGYEDVGGRHCLKIHATPRDSASGGSIVTAWIAPELDFAIVREEYHSYFPAISPDSEPIHDTTWITVASDFVEVADALWCPRTVEATYYRHRRDDPPGSDPWEYTQVLHIDSMDVNAPLVGITTPYPFPEGTKVTDLTSATAAASGEEDK